MKNRKIGLIVTIITVLLLIAGCGAKQENASTSKQEKDLPEFHYAMSGLYKPFNFKENGKLVGFDVEIGQALAEKMGMKAAPVTNPWETLIQGLVSKKYDAILGSMAITPEREKTVSFTQPYYRSGAQIFVNKDNTTIKSLDDLKGKKIGVLKASVFKDLALKVTDKENLIEYDSDLTALMDLPTGRVAAVITDDMVGLRMMKEGAVPIKEAGKPLTHSEAGIAVRKENKELLEKLNKALDEIINDGTYEKISKKWFGRSILGSDQ